MKPSHTLLAILFSASTATRAQVVPATPSPAGPLVSGTLRYDMRYSQTAQFGGSQDGQQWSFSSGDASYSNTSERLPFSMQYGGGYGWAWAGPTSVGNVFQHLLLSQGIVGRKWNLMASDSVSYSFQAPTTGFSGIPGTGEPIGGSGPTVPPDQTILTQNTRTLNNTTNIGLGYKLNYAWSLNVGDQSEQLRYIDNNGQNTDIQIDDAGITRRLNARDSMSGQYSYSRYSYSGTGLTSPATTLSIAFSQVNTAQFSFNRQWNRQIKTSVFAGPQWVSSSNSTIVPSSTGVSASALVIDTLRFGSASLNYNHGTTSGSGYMSGAETDVASANFTREIGRNLTVGLTGSYMRTAGLGNNEVTNAMFGGAQGTRQLGRYFNLFANYTAIHQSSNFQNSANVLSGIYQVIGFGIGYSPHEKYFRK
ncbi:MAG: hypothetical protein ABSE51_08990 [Terracidiphilus sp.]|jgi:hypothetical protein